MTAPDAGTLSLAGRDVPRMGYGTMRLTGPRIFGPPADRDEAVRVLRRAVELGVRVIDTSWYYGPYVANEILAEALHPYGDDLVVITKLGGARRDDGSWYSALTPDELRAGCEHDLRLLRVDSVPVAHLRWMPGAEVPFDEALGAMIGLRDVGKIQHIGCRGRLAHPRPRHPVLQRHQHKYESLLRARETRDLKPGTIRTWPACSWG